MTYLCSLVHTLRKRQLPVVELRSANFGFVVGPATRWGRFRVGYPARRCAKSPEQAGWGRFKADGVIARGLYSLLTPGQRRRLRSLALDLSGHLVQCGLPHRTLGL